MNLSAALVALVPPVGVVTVTSTVPEPAGDVAVMRVAFLTMKLAAVVPKSTALAPENAVPVKVTVVPPAAGPDVGPMEVTMGAGV